MKNRTRRRVTTTFLYTLGIVSIIGFLAIITNTWFNFEWLTKNNEALILIVLGIGLIVEGQLMKWKYFARGGLSTNEFAHIVTGVIGVLSLVVGLLTLATIESATINGVKGVVASIAVIVIIIQIWWIKN